MKDFGLNSLLRLDTPSVNSRYPSKILSGRSALCSLVSSQNFSIKIHVCLGINPGIKTECDNYMLYLCSKCRYRPHDQYELGIVTYVKIYY